MYNVKHLLHWHRPYILTACTCWTCDLLIGEGSFCLWCIVCCRIGLTGPWNADARIADTELIWVREGGGNITGGVAIGGMTRPVCAPNIDWIYVGLDTILLRLAGLTRFGEKESSGAHTWAAGCCTRWPTAWSAWREWSGCEIALTLS